MLKRSDLEPDQVAEVDWLKVRSGALCALPIGMGKTIICLTALTDIREVYGPWRVLLVSTKSICNLTWEQEIAKWEHTAGKWSYANAAGRNKKAAQAGADITAVNFESIEWYLDLVDEGKVELPEILVVDESSKFKAPTAKRTARLAGMRYVSKSKGIKHYQNFPGYIHRFKRRFLLSATPNPESYGDLWAQSCLIDTRRRLGENPTDFRRTYCQRDRSGFGWDEIGRAHV